MAIKALESRKTTRSYLWNLKNYPHLCGYFLPLRNNDEMTKKLESYLQICHLNIEVIKANVSASRGVAIQKTHAKNKDHLLSRGSIYAYGILGATFQLFLKWGKLQQLTISPLADHVPQKYFKYNHPFAYVGDFDSPHVTWKY